MRLFYVVLFVWSTLALGQDVVKDIGELPNDIWETSGLIYYNGRLITHNDSGGTPQLFELDTLSRQIARTVTVSNIENIDWEALSQDESYIYIGDFGNNVGTRTNLKVYRISKSDYNTSDTVMAETIGFTYEDQTQFEDNGNSDWDAEAFFVFGDELIVLTKQWQSSGSVAYAFPKTPGNHVAEQRDVVINMGLITDAHYNTETKTLFIIGYNSFLAPFVVSYTDITKTDIFNDTGTRTDLDIGIAQVEGLTSDTLGNYYFTSEYFTRASPSITSSSRLFKFEYQSEQNPEPDPLPEEPKPEEPEPIGQIDEEVLILYKDASSNELKFEINSDKKLYGLRIYDVYGKLVWHSLDSDLMKEGVLTNHLPNAVHYFVVYFSDAIVSKGFLSY
ncbi:hypothetical protein ACOCEA_10115 [Maribacter sp. CXY002]|uniref:hypothetical protein n=1 Tax=Maribacter luteocoastalis TaxID=3407671 RepID=UPI003B66FDEC